MLCVTRPFWLARDSEPVPHNGKDCAEQRAKAETDRHERAGREGAVWSELKLELEEVKRQDEAQHLCRPADTHKCYPDCVPDSEDRPHGHGGLRDADVAHGRPLQEHIIG